MNIKELIAFRRKLTLVTGTKYSGIASVSAQINGGENTCLTIAPICEAAQYDKYSAEVEQHRQIVVDIMSRLFDGETFKIQVLSVTDRTYVFTPAYNDDGTAIYRAAEQLLNFVVMLTCKARYSNQDLSIILPEAYLSPQRQTNLAHLVVKWAKLRQGRVIMGTYSPYVFNGIRAEVKEGALWAEEVNVFFVKQAKGVHKTISTHPIDKDGRIENWPEGFFDNYNNSLIRVL